MIGGSLSPEEPQRVRDRTKTSNDRTRIPPPHWIGSPDRHHRGSGSPLAAANGHSRTISDSDPLPDTDFNIDFNVDIDRDDTSLADLHRESHIHLDVDIDLDSHPYGDNYLNSNLDSIAIGYPDPFLDLDTHGDFHVDRNPHTQPDAHRDFNPNPDNGRPA